MTDISVVVPLLNEEESLPELCEWIARVMSLNKYSYQILLIDDGSTDNSWNVIEELEKKDENISGIKFRRNYGKSGALFVGFERAKGDVVITMDADLQDSPDEIPELYNMIMKEGYDLVSGWKKKRYDPISKTLPSKFFNRTARAVTGIKLHDFNCGLKAYKRAVIKNIEVYGEMHRYIPVLAKQAGFKNIGEKVVEHRERKYGVSKFGMERFVKGFLDLMSVIFITKWAKRPMHLFGGIGTLMFIFGFIAAGYLGIHKIYCVISNIPAKLIVDSAYFYIALASMIIGAQLFIAGFLAELVSRSSSSRNDYKIEKEI
ncbi:MAG: glycosyltransferase family 2 protein [Bacteroidales bacterium]|jgi:glycosyltransferase involved in cell wall biosynthesis|nr:glycosyltransferase family 2 protein [Bacteroidales bacterium]